jgi:hypothetical protein
MNTRNMVVWVCGVWWCVKIQHCTHTYLTRLGNTAALPVPMLHPICHGGWCLWWSIVVVAGSGSNGHGHGGMFVEHH